MRRQSLQGGSPMRVDIVAGAVFPDGEGSGRRGSSSAGCTACPCSCRPASRRSAPGGCRQLTLVAAPPRHIPWHKCRSATKLRGTLGEGQSRARPRSRWLRQRSLADPLGGSRVERLFQGAGGLLGHSVTCRSSSLWQPARHSHGSRDRWTCRGASIRQIDRLVPQLGWIGGIRLFLLLRLFFSLFLRIARIETPRAVSGADPSDRRRVRITAAASEQQRGEKNRATCEQHSRRGLPPLRRGHCLTLQLLVWWGRPGDGPNRIRQLQCTPVCSPVQFISSRFG